jgi:carboxyl-terminal processing protease
MKAQKRIGFRIVLALLLALALTGTWTTSSTWAATTDQVNEVRNLLEQYHLNKPDDKDLNGTAIDAMVNSLHDPYTQYFDPEQWKTFSDSLEQTFVGIGIVMTEEKGVVSVEDVITGSPAEAAGVLPGDAIVSADGKSVKGVSVTELQKQLRGAEGTTLTIGVTREGKTFSYAITRKSVQLPITTGQMMADGVGYLALSGFSSDAGDAFRKQLDKLEQAGMSSLVIDLRNNGGGYVNAAQQIAGYFLKDGVLAHLKDRDGNDSPLTVQGGGKSYPITILVNGNSASASELFAGALQDYGVAKLVGTQTFGKGVVQSILPLQSGGVLKVTVQEYFTPNGHKVNKKGLTPDHVVIGSGEQLIQAYRDAGGHALSMTTAKGAIIVNGVRTVEPDAAVLRGNQWYANVRLASALAGADVGFDPKTHTITLTDKVHHYSIKLGDKRLTSKHGWNLIDIRAMQNWFPNLSVDTAQGQLRITVK